LQTDYYLRMKPGIFQAFWIKIDGREEELSEAGIRIILDKVQSLLHNILQPKCHELLLYKASWACVGIMNYESGKSEEVRRSLRDCFSHLEAQKNMYEPVTFSIALGCGAGEAEKLTMERFTRPIVNALRGLGLRAEASGRNDILVEGRKVSGTAQRLLDGRILHHGTLLFDADPGMVAGALRADPEKFRSKSAKSVRSRIGNIREFLREDMDLPAFWEYLKTALAGAGFVGGGLTAEELEGVEALKREKYDTWEWNFGRSPAYDMMNRRHWDGGSLEVRLSVKGGRITGIAFLGDFLSRCPLEPLTEALRGVPFRREDVTEVLERQPLSDYFGGITTAEILETIFHVCE